MVHTLRRKNSKSDYFSNCMYSSPPLFENFDGIVNYVQAQILRQMSWCTVHVDFSSRVSVNNGNTIEVTVWHELEDRIKYRRHTIKMSFLVGRLCRFRIILPGDCIIVVGYWHMRSKIITRQKYLLICCNASIMPCYSYTFPSLMSCFHCFASVPVV